MTTYRLRDTKASSKRFGPCECCGEHVTEVFLQVEEVDGQRGDDLFGHRACLIAARKAS